jgi:mono/diheme cytochrome c family protein
MPAYEGILTDAEIAAVLAYFKSSWPPEFRAIQARHDGAGAVAIIIIEAWFKPT